MKRNFLDHLAEAKKAAENRPGTSNGDVNPVAESVPVPLWVLYGLINEVEMARQPSVLTDPALTQSAVCGYPEPKSFREIKQEIKNGSSV